MRLAGIDRHRRQVVAGLVPIMALILSSASCKKMSRISLQGLKGGTVTTSVTISCPGQATRTVRTVVSVEGCSYSADQSGYAVDFVLDGVDFRCLSNDSTSTGVGGFTCAGAWSLTKVTLVPGRFVTADESYMSGSITVDNQSCDLQIAGPLYPASSEFKFCPSDLDGGVDGGTNAGPDSGTDAGADGGP